MLLSLGNLTKQNKAHIVIDVPVTVCTSVLLSSEHWTCFLWIQTTENSGQHRGRGPYSPTAHAPGLHQTFRKAGKNELSTLRDPNAWSQNSTGEMQSFSLLRGKWVEEYVTNLGNIQHQIIKKKAFFKSYSLLLLFKGLGSVPLL